MSSNPKSRWKLSTISNVTLLLLYLVGAVALVILVNVNTKQQALRNAELYSSMILDRNVVTHSFFNKVLKTSLYDLFEEHFFEPTWLSSTFAINSVASDYGLFTQKDLYYKEFAINARNPIHEAGPMERRFIERLNANPNLITESAIREYDHEPFFTVMRRGQVVKEDCLFCHGDPQDAPPGIVDHYGAQKGFYLRPGQTISAISIRIPLAMAYQEANHFSFKLSGFLLALLLAIFAFQYIVTRQLLFVPIDTLYRKAKRIAHEPEHLGDALPIPSGQELAELVEAFNSMSTGLLRHQDSLEQTIRERTAELEEANQTLNDDIEIRKEVERTLEQLRHRNEMILNTTSEGILGLDSAGQITFFNRAAEDLMGLEKEQTGQVKIQDFISHMTTEQEQSKQAELITEVLAKGTKIDHQEGLICHVNGRTFPIEYSCAPLLGNGITGAVFSFSDITERKRSECEIQNLAFYDQLTGLPNRTLFYDRITQRVAQAVRDKQRLALMFLDLDDFKIINDTLGHAAGDDFLSVIAKRLRESSRQADTVARLGGDEFVWFGEIDDEEDIRRIAGKFLEGIAQPVKLDQHNFSSTVSIGIAIFPDSAQDVLGLMKCADSAMYRVKQKSKNAFQFYR